MSVNRQRLLLVNAIAVFAYLSCILQWLLATAPYIPSVIQSDLFETYVNNPSSQTAVPVAPVSDMFSGLFVVIATLISVVVVVAGVIAIYRTPRAIGKTGAKLTHGAADAVLPVVTRHKKITPTKRRLLTARLVFDIKLVLVVVPLLLVLIAPPDAIQNLSHEVIVVVAAVLAAWSLFLFCLQVIVARALRINVDHIW